MSAHTPGPWGAWQPLNNGEWAVTAWEAGDLSARLGDPARLPPRIADEIERGADARLIAAAPDLLAIAQRYVDSQDPCVRGDGTCRDDNGCVACELTADARAAIAKASPP